MNRRNLTFFGDVGLQVFSRVETLFYRLHSCVAIVRSGTRSEAKFRFKTAQPVSPGLFSVWSFPKRSNTGVICCLKRNVRQ